jgi:very-short-patch-repair endonuclease
MRQVDGTEALARVRRLRREATEAEKRLWAHLRARRLDDHKFRHQVWIGPFVADFLCKEAKLIVEVDGSQHAEATDYDARRSGYLAARGYRVLRFWNNDVMNDLASVLEAIRTSLPSPSHAASPRGPHPLPSGEGR